MDFVLLCVVIVHLIIVIVMIGLLKIYFDSYKKIKVGYTFGLLWFAFLIFVKNVVSIINIIFLNDSTFFAMRGGIVEPAIELIAVCILYKITRD